MATESELLALHTSGTLLENIFGRFGGMKRDQLTLVRDTCATLHNAGAVNLLALLTEQSLEIYTGSKFFMGQQFYCDVIPLLNSSAEELIEAVALLIKKGGNDGAAGWPINAFEKWCQADPTRAQEVISLAESNSQILGGCLTVALATGNFADIAIRFIERYTDNRRLAAVTALGSMKLLDAKSTSQALDLFKTLISADPDDFTRAKILDATIRIIASGNNRDERGIEIISIACAHPGEATHYYCAQALLQHARQLDSNAIRLLLMALETLNIEHKGTVNTLDIACSELLGGPNADLVTDYFTKVIKENGASLRLSSFDSIRSELINGDRQRFHRLFISWMLSGNFALCSAAGELHNDSPEIFESLTQQGQNLTPKERVFICRKAIGFFFIRPTIAAAVVVSMLRIHGDAACLEEIRDLLFDPLLQNYSGGVTGYLESIVSDDAAYGYVQQALKRMEEYLTSIRSTPLIKELHPSEHHQQIARNHFHDEMLTAHKAAQKRSVFLNLVSHSTILFGKKSLSYIYENGTSPRPIEMELKEIGASFEFPRGELLDPVHLNYLLMVFRTERLGS